MENKKSKFLDFLTLLFNFFKIGCFTFGGGLAMIPIMQRIIVSKYHWVEDEEFADMIAIAESTPGAIAVNMATFVGYRKYKLLGAILTTLALVLGPFTVIIIVTSILTQFKENIYIQGALYGISCGVVVLILKGFLSLSKIAIKDVEGLIIFVLALLISLFLPKTNLIIVLIIFAVFGIVYQTLKCKKLKEEKK